MSEHLWSGGLDAVCLKCGARKLTAHSDATDADADRLRLALREERDTLRGKMDIKREIDECPVDDEVQA